eukprot:7269299-Prymnesium_polylepis.2
MDAGLSGETSTPRTPVARALRQAASAWASVTGRKGKGTPQRNGMMFALCVGLRALPPPVSYFAPARTPETALCGGGLWGR